MPPASLARGRGTVDGHVANAGGLASTHDFMWGPLTLRATTSGHETPTGRWSGTGRSVWNPDGGKQSANRRCQLVANQLLLGQNRTSITSRPASLGQPSAPQGSERRCAIHRQQQNAELWNSTKFRIGTFRLRPHL